MIYTIEIPDDQLAELALAVATKRGWTPTVKDENGEDVPNPITPNAVLTEATRVFWQNELDAYRAEKAKPVVEPLELALTVL